MFQRMLALRATCFKRSHIAVPARDGLADHRLLSKKA
jgi:hypothetical protein